MESILNQLPLLLILLFTMITFLQSGLDKLLDWKGNVGWLQEHFKGTFMGTNVPLLVGILLILELASGLMAAGGFLQLLLNGEEMLSHWALGLAATTLLMLLLGQRVAKDYAGAFTITGYFIVIIFGLYISTL